MRRTLAIQAGGYLVLLALIYEWLGIEDRTFAQVLLSAVLGGGISFGAVWLFGNALAAPQWLGPRRLPKVLPWAAAVAAVIIGAMWLAGYRDAVGLSVASRLTLWLRRPVKLETIASLYAGLVWIAGAAGVLALLPYAGAAARADRQAEGLPHRRYWIGCAVLMAAGYWLPSLLVGWVPKAHSFGAQTASLVVRFSLAYAIALAAWVEIAGLARRYRYAATR
jgi:hypothetical protein